MRMSFAFLLCVGLVGCHRRHTLGDAGGPDSGDVGTADGFSDVHLLARCELAPGVFVYEGLESECSSCPNGLRRWLPLYPATSPEGILICTGAAAYNSRPVGNAGAMCNAREVSVDTREGLRGNPCVTPEVCAYFWGPEDSDPHHCVYPDGTRVVTGDFPLVDCREVQRAAGACAEGCLCPEGQACYGRSEVHGVGTCIDVSSADAWVEEICAHGAQCGDGEACLIPEPDPEWLSETFWRREFPAGASMQGRCVTAEACQAMVDANSPDYRCEENPE